MIEDLKQLYEQYCQCIEVQEQIIKACRRDYIKALNEKKWNESERLGRILKTYYEERNDLMISANDLKKYIL